VPSGPFDDLDKYDQHGHTPLFRAVRGYDHEEVERLNMHMRWAEGILLDHISMYSLAGNGGATALLEDGTARRQPILTLPVPKRTKAEKPGRCGDRLLEKYFHFLPVWSSGLSEQSHTQQKKPICGLAHLPISYFSFVKNDQTPQTTRQLTRKRFSFFVCLANHSNTV
jgi:hypothetical protein